MIQSGNMRIRLTIGSEEAVFICRRPTTRESSNFLNTRWVRGKRNKIDDRLYEARRAFIDLILVDLEEVVFKTAAGEVVPLNAAAVLSPADIEHWSQVLGEPVKSWKDLIPVQWKSSVAQRFEDVPNFDGDEEEGEAAAGN
jgi:hypothetical protein